MSSYCLRCRKNTENVSPRASKTSNCKTILFSKYAICGAKKSRFFKKQEAKEILSSLGLKTTSSKVALLDDILF